MYIAVVYGYKFTEYVSGSAHYQLLLTTSMRLSLYYPFRGDYARKLETAERARSSMRTTSG